MFAVCVKYFWGAELRWSLLFLSRCQTNRKHQLMACHLIAFAWVSAVNIIELLHFNEEKKQTKNKKYCKWTISKLMNGNDHYQFRVIHYHLTIRVLSEHTFIKSFWPQGNKYGTSLIGNTVSGTKYFNRIQQFSESVLVTMLR